MTKPQINELWTSPSWRIVTIDSVGEEDGNLCVKYHQVAPDAETEDMMPTMRSVNDFLSVYKRVE